MGRGGNIAVEDFGLGAFSLFVMQSESFLSRQRALEKGRSRSNCQTLFGIGHIPSDHYIRDNLDPVDPVHLQPLFNRIEAQLAKPAMKEEFIAKQDGAEKQDCERNAVKRWFAKHGTRVKSLKPVYLGDSIVTLTAFILFPNWSTLLASLATFEIPPNLLKNHNSPC